MKLYIIAGEASGDLHGSNLIYALKKLNPSIEVRCWGGDLMQQAGGELVKHYRDLAFMGFAEVVLNLKTILKNLKFCKSDIQAFRPDAVIFIDYPGFNMRIAPFVKQLNIPSFYYIPPQIWAWNQKRVFKIKKYINHVFSVLPFELEFYEKFNVPVTFVGHPLLDAVQKFQDKFTVNQEVSNKPIIAILPGSRKQEISKKLPLMLKVAANYSNTYQIIVAGAPGQTKEYYEPFLANYPHVQIKFGQTYELLNQAHAALVTSGTATLETALFKVPQVVCYVGHPISYAIAKRLVKIKYISLVNLIMDKPLVTELIQHDFNEAQLKYELNQLLEGKKREEILNGYSILAEKLGNAGASEITAKQLLKTIQSQASS